MPQEPTLSEADRALIGLATPEQLELLAGRERWQRPEVLGLVLDRIDGLGYERPERAIEASRIAHSMGKAIGEERLGPDLMAALLGTMATAHQLGGEGSRALELLEQATTIADISSTALARLYRRRALVRLARQETEKAKKALALALELFGRSKSDVEIAICKDIEAVVVAFGERDFSSSVAIAAQGLPLVDPETDDQLYLHLLRQVTDCLFQFENGPSSLVRELLQKARLHFDRRWQGLGRDTSSSSRWSSLRAVWGWIDGLLAAQAGELESAHGELLEASARLEEAGSIADAVLCLLDRCLLEPDAGITPGCAQLLQEAWQLAWKGDDFSMLAVINSYRELHSREGLVAARVTLAGKRQPMPSPSRAGYRTWVAAGRT